VTTLALRVTLTVVLFSDEHNDDRFQVLALTEGQAEPVDVTDQYQVLAAEIPSTGRKGFTVVKI